MFTVLFYNGLKEKVMSAKRWREAKTSQEKRKREMPSESKQLETILDAFDSVKTEITLPSKLKTLITKLKAVRKKHP